ncbi:signal transduction histidine kinase [Pseudochelatococcus lubricantis]|uniref:histidine kinase n=1 Tax=Pseudochelatococcus lubricantis TaxID=1538102 RepID=A0ABX0V406_9HYPH|nr:HAMP domain-containing sensor histidine kinase [Pseudochelatococcus lubricantis]NIJ59851.1 signal transduction histidine kinase [Pseudochelatococcus lubricantis]
MQIARSLRLRLLAFAVVVLAATMVLTGLGLTALFTRHLERRVGQELDTHLRQLIGAVRFDAEGRMSLMREPADPRFMRVLGGLYWQVEDRTDDQFIASRSLWNEMLALPVEPSPQGGVEVSRITGPRNSILIVHERAIVIAVQGVDRLIRVSVAIDRAEIEPLLAGFARDLVVALGILSTVLLAGFAIQIRAGLKPLYTVRNALGDIRSGAATRLATDVPEEVAPLVEEINALLAAQERELGRARDRAADLAHGLRTPLTALAGDVRRLHDRGEVSIARDISEIVQSMSRHVDRELARARIRHGGPGAATPLARTVDDLIRTLERTPDGERVRFENTVPTEMKVTIDPQDLNEMLGNLMENAARHAQSRVRISAATGKDAQSISVEDDGPGLQDPERATAALRGVKLDINGPGAGLGLAIVQDIANAYNAELKLGSAEPGGLAAEIWIPLTHAARR